VVNYISASRESYIFQTLTQDTFLLYLYLLCNNISVGNSLDCSVGLQLTHGGIGTVKTVSYV